MLKILFWTLLLGNGALFAYHQGYLDALLAPEREPARMSRQIDADKVKVLPPGAVKQSQNHRGKPAGESQAAPSQSPVVVEPVAVAAQEPMPTEKKGERIACTEIGNFNETDAGRFEQQLATLALGQRLSRRVIQEKTSHIVYIPPQGSKENADKKVGQLRNLGVSDFYVIQENSDMRWGISLGLFSSEAAANARLAKLSEQGVRTARIGVRNGASKLAFQLRDLDAAAMDGLAKIKADYPQQQMRNCA